MDHLAPSNVPVFATAADRRAIWERCRSRRQPVIAIKDAPRDYVVTYDLQHLDQELADDALQSLRDRVRSRRPYPTDTDPLSETESVGGEAGGVFGTLHAPTESEARDLASHLSAFVFDRRNWR